MSRNHRPPRGKPRVSPTVFERLNPHVAGIDCGAAAHFVAVPPDRDPTPVQAFPTFTSDLRRLADDLERGSLDPGSLIVNPPDPETE